MTTKKASAAKRPSRRSNAASAATRQSVESLLHPNRVRLVDGSMYQAMQRAVLRALPGRSPGLTFSELSLAVLPLLPVDLYPGGAKSGWWLKVVQLDLEAKQIIVREKTTPLRLHRASARPR